MTRIRSRASAFCFLLIVVILQAPAAGQCAQGMCEPAAKPHAAVVRVASVGSGGSRCYGSGTLVHNDAERGIVLTCAHLFRQETGNVSVTFPDGRRFEADLLAIDQAWDLAALKIAETQVAPVTIADDHPMPGDQLQSCGYGSDGRFWCNQGRVLGYARTAATATYETLELSGHARDGDSGGPVFNASGELVAVLWGTDGRMVGGTYCGRIRKFLHGILPLGNLPPQPPESTPPALGPSPDAASPPPPGDHLDEIRRRLDGLAGEFEDAKRQQADRERSWGDRVDKIEQAAGLVAGLKDRIERAENAVGDKNLRAVAREVAVGILADRGPGLAQTILPAVFTALGWTTPPSAAVIVGLYVLRGLVRRRRRKRKSEEVGGRKSEIGGRRVGKGPTSNFRPPALNDDYAEQLARVYALSGRSPMADVTLGREYDEELRRAEESSDTALAHWAQGLRQRVARRFYRIHDESPLPSEPPNASGLQGDNQ